MILDAIRRYSRGRSKILRTKTSKINSFITAICGEMEVRSLELIIDTFFYLFIQVDSIAYDSVNNIVHMAMVE